MEQSFSWQAPTEFEISFGNTYNFSPQSSDTRGLWTSTSCSNLLSEDDIYNTRGEKSDTNFKEWQLYSSEKIQEPFCSDCQESDFVAPILAKRGPLQGEPSTGSFPQLKQTNTTIAGVKSGGEEVLGSVIYGERNRTFVQWNGSPYLPSLRPQNSQSLHKRCIRFLKCINDHRINPLHDIHGGRRVNHGYDKLAIHHVVAERKRREQMKQIFSTLRVLLPIDPKQKGRAPVLLQTIDYVAHLKQRVEQLERRNGELEALLHEKSDHN